MNCGPLRLLTVWSHPPKPLNLFKGTDAHRISALHGELLYLVFIKHNILCTSDEADIDTNVKSQRYSQYATRK